MMRFICVLIFYSFSLNIYALDESDAFYTRLSEKYLQKDVLSYSYSVTQYDTTGTNILKSLTGIVNQSREKFSYELGDMKVVFQDSFYAMIYPERKAFYYHIVSNNILAQTKKFDVGSIIAELKKNKVKVEKDSNCMDPSLDCYNLVFGHLDKDLYQIKIDKRTGYISELRVDYYGADEKQHIQNYIIHIKYSNYKLIKLDKFNPLGEYVAKRGKEIILKPEFQDYIINKF